MQILVQFFGPKLQANFCMFPSILPRKSWWSQWMFRDFVMLTKSYYTNPKMMVWYFVNDSYKVFMMTTHCRVISNCRFEYVFAISLILKCHWDLMKLRMDSW